MRDSQEVGDSGYRERDSGKKYRVRSRKLEVLGTRRARLHTGCTGALRRTGRGPAGPAQPPPFPRLSACAPSGPPKASAGSPTPSPPDAASEPERPGRGGPNGGRPPANRRRQPARSPPPRRADPRGLGAGSTSQRRQAPPTCPPNRRCVPALRPRPQTLAASCGPRPMASATPPAASPPAQRLLVRAGRAPLRPRQEKPRGRAESQRPHCCLAPPRVEGGLARPRPMV